MFVYSFNDIVVPLVGTWIETASKRLARFLNDVVPLVGTWIETGSTGNRSVRIRSFPLWERGLKLVLSFLAPFRAVSFPLWERGLQHADTADTAMHCSVVPLVGTWIETPFVKMAFLHLFCRSPCGNVD